MTDSRSVPDLLLPTGVPVHLTRLIGREREADEVTQLLRSTRLVTLTGAGGSGKTRLAAEVASRLAPDFPHGLAWIELDPLHDPALLELHVAAACGLREDPGRPPMEALLDALRARSMLLVLDNCEHLVDACATLAETLLLGCPAVRILATSREALGIGGERVWLVPPLSLPERSSSTTAVAAARSEAVELFMERARAVNPRFKLSDGNATAIARICRRLDGIPLAIELAAARAGALTPEQIAQRLDDAFRLLAGGTRTALPRQRTLRGTIDWSHALLTEPERILLRRLSVFAGGFSLEAAEAIGSAPGLERGGVLDALFGLVDKSLVLAEVREEEVRYRLLETVRQYGLERLRDAEEVEPSRSRHAHFFLCLAETAEPYLFGGAAETEWIGRLTEESDNLRAAADWAAEDPSRVELELRLGAALHWFWFARGHFAEGRQRLTLALERGCSVSPAVRIRALAALGHVALWQGDHASMRAPVEASVCLARELDDDRHLPYPLALLAAVSTLTGDLETALAAAEEAITAGGDFPEPPLLRAFAFFWRAIAAQGAGDYVLARSSIDESIAVARRLKHQPGIAYGLYALGRLAWLQHEPSTAQRALIESLALHRETGDRWGTVQVLSILAQIAEQRGQPERTARLLGAVARLRDRMGVKVPHFELESFEALSATVRGRLAEETFAAAWAEGQALTFDQAVAYALEDATLEMAPPPAEPTGTGGGAEAIRSPREAVPEPVVRVLALGPLQIFRDGERLEDEVWGWSKPRELLLFLACHPDGCTRDQVGLAFWPDASAAQVRNNFHVMLNRARRVLGKESIALVDNRYRIAPSVNLEFDAARFEKRVTALLAEVRAGRTPGDDPRDVLALYRGDFLEQDVVGDWHLEYRDRLSRLYVQGLMAHGDLLVQAGEFHEAADVFYRVVLREDLQEDAHRRYMFCLARSGERSRALRHYEQMVQLLRDELDAAPEPESVALFQRLRSADGI